VFSVAGLALRAVVRMRADRAATAVQRALSGRDVFGQLADAVGRGWRYDWIGHVAWEEAGVGASIVHEAGGDAPAQAALTGWLVREAESGTAAIVAPGAE